MNYLTGILLPEEYPESEKARGILVKTSETSVNEALMAERF